MKLAKHHPLAGRRVKVCKCCAKKKVLEAFSIAGANADGRKTECKLCESAKQRQRRADLNGGQFMLHRWDANDQCKRCGCNRIRKAHPYRAGAWNVTYHANGKISSKPPTCIAVGVVESNKKRHE